MPAWYPPIGSGFIKNDKLNGKAGAFIAPDRDVRGFVYLTPIAAKLQKTTVNRRLVNFSPCCPVGRRACETIDDY